MKKYYLFRALLLILISLMSVLPSKAQFSGSGSGTENDPYLIFNETQLAQVSNFLNQDSVVFRLMKDLDLTAWITENNPRQGWLPIGVESMPFMGKFLGNNHKISGLMINRKSIDYVGFFGYLSNATVENLSLEGSSVAGLSCVGGFIGYSVGSEITNCNLTLTAAIGVDGANNVGGFVGQSYNSNYSSFTVETTVHAQSNLGGFVGIAEGDTFQQGNIIGKYDCLGSYSGGFAGKLTGVSVSDICQKGDMTGQDYTGGFAGCCSTGNFTNCNVESDVDGSQFVSGFIGALENTTSSFNNIYHKGALDASGDYLGGIVGVSNGGCIEEMESCSHFGDINGHNYVGGLVGAILNLAEEPILHTYKYYFSGSDHFYYDNINTGSNLQKRINNCTAICNIDGQSYVGGIIGYSVTCKGFTYESHTATVQHIYRNGSWHTVTVTYYDENGINVGTSVTYYDYYRNTIELSFTNNYYCGTTKGQHNVGGLVGYISGGSIQNNYVNSNIFGSSNVGGIAGQINTVENGNHQENGSYQATTTLKSNVAVLGTISATSENVGRIYGSISSESTTIGDLGSSESNRALTHAHVILSGIAQDIDDDLQNGTGTGPSALKLKANYVSWGWNFDENWNILETESFPFKKYQAAPPVIESNLISQATSISGKSIDGGTVYLFYKDRDAISTESSNYTWIFETEPLQSGAIVQVYSEVEGMAPSYFTTAIVGYPGSGTEEDPWRIYTADDLQGASNRGYYKVMNDIDLSQWIIDNNPEHGWIPIGRNSGDATYIDGDSHTISGLWISTTDNFNGLFSNFSAGQIKNLNVEVASGKSVKGGDYTGVLIGRNANGSIVNCSIKGDVEGTMHVGGVSGYAVATTINNVQYNGQVNTCSENAFVGGLVGQSEGCSISVCRTNSIVSSANSNNNVGGLVGCAIGGLVEKTVANTNVAANGTNGHVGGLVGHNESVISQSFASGNVSSTGDDSYTGGLVGYSMSPIHNCYSNVHVIGTLYSAGLVGYTYSSIDKCYAMGDIEGVMYGAGIVGALDGPNSFLTNSIAANNILTLSAQTSWGSRVIGGFKNGSPDPELNNYALSTMQVSLNNVPQIKTDDMVEGISKTEEILKQRTTYEGLDWDMVNVWDVDEGIDYPFLRASAETEIPITESLTIENQVTINIGDTYSIKVDISPNAANKELNWTSSNPSVVSVNNNGEITAMQTGRETITAFTTDGSNLSSSCIVTVIDATTNSLDADPINLRIGDNKKLPVRMNNEATITAIQADIYLPEGVSIATEDGDYLIDLVEARKGTNHTVSTNVLPNGAIRMFITSATSKPFKGNDGELFILNLVVDRDAVCGDYSLDLRNVILSDVNAQTYYAPDLNIPVIIQDFIKGDVNTDGTVNVSDYVVTANYILELNPQPFVFAAADIDENETINVSDLVGVANIVLNFLGAHIHYAPATSYDGLSIMDFAINCNITASGRYLVTLDLNNSNAITAFQMDVTLPMGMKMVNANLSDRATSSHSLELVELSNGTYRLLGSSIMSKAFVGNEGALLTLEIEGTALENAIIDGIMLAEPNTALHKHDAIMLSFDTSSVHEMYSEVRIYTQNGMVIVESPVADKVQFILPNGINVMRDVKPGRNVYSTGLRGIVIVKLGDQVKKFRL